MARRTEQFPANDGGAGAIGRKVEHHWLIIPDARTLGAVGADELRFYLLGHHHAIATVRRFLGPQLSDAPIHQTLEHAEGDLGRGLRVVEGFRVTTRE
jgi:hypothetical protein